MQGLKRIVNDLSHRKELVAGNLGEHITTRMSIRFASLPHFDLYRGQNFMSLLSASVTMPATSMK
jgi:hypothetical protein